ncbi:hypothetical protein CRG98_039000 [Punica granatum]|uniref:Protein DETOXIFICATION n=1 Tax=Punica granatum TaxID=22663 RepID=A0A2I0IA86_PUNGR|nr:hypothetical protein CRG98_039000 [Punica granatum]
MELQVKQELASLCKTAFLALLTGLFLYSKNIISMVFMGQLGNTELAGGSLSISLANITCHSIMKGLGVGMEPICAQAYGARQCEVLCATYKRAICLLLVMAFPISLLWLNIEPVLRLFGQEPQTVYVAQIYLKYLVPDLLAQVSLVPLRNFLRAQNLNEPITAAAVCATILHIPINYTLAIYLNMGVRGVALASACYSFCLNLVLIVYLILSRTPLKPWEWKTQYMCSEGWLSLLSFAVPSLFSTCLEWWWYEIMMLMCCMLENPPASIASMGILIQTTGFIYVVPHSLNSALSMLVGQNLGAQKPALARKIAIIGLIMAAICGLFALAFTIAVRNLWGQMFTAEPQILSLVSATLPIVGLCELGNSPQTAACGILSGSGRPKRGTIINLTSFYLIGFPLSWLLSFKLNIGFVGLWYALAAAQASSVCMIVYTLVRTDWQAQAESAGELIQRRPQNENNDLEENLLNGG